VNIFLRFAQPNPLPFRKEAFQVFGKHIQSSFFDRTFLNPAIPGTRKFVNPRVDFAR
jgi:hypothetical protein